MDWKYTGEAAITLALLGAIPAVAASVLQARCNITFQ
jgi:hypothetical protein